MSVLTPIHVRNAIEALLSMYALTNMHVSCGEVSHAQLAYDWLPNIERNIEFIRGELEQELGIRPGDIE